MYAMNLAHTIGLGQGTITSYEPHDALSTAIMQAVRLSGSSALQPSLLRSVGPDEHLATMTARAADVHDRTALHAAAPASAYGNMVSPTIPTFRPHPMGEPVSDSLSPACNESAAEERQEPEGESELYRELETTTRWDEATPCTVCKRVFATKYQAKKHFMRTHYKGEKEHVCTMCNNKSFAVKEDLTTHQKACGRVFVCSCGMRLRSYATLKRHCRLTGHDPKSWEGYTLAKPLEEAARDEYKSPLVATRSTPLPAPAVMQDTDLFAQLAVPAAAAAAATKASAAAPFANSFGMIGLFGGTARGADPAEVPLFTQLRMPRELVAGAGAGGVDDVLTSVMRSLMYTGIPSGSEPWVMPMSSHATTRLADRPAAVSAGMSYTATR